MRIRFLCDARVSLSTTSADDCIQAIPSTLERQAGQRIFIGDTFSGGEILDSIFESFKYFAMGDAAEESAVLRCQPGCRAIAEADY